MWRIRTRMFCSHSHSHSHPVFKAAKPTNKQSFHFPEIDIYYGIVVLSSSFLGGTYAARNAYIATRDLDVSKCVSETTLAFICGIPFGLISGILSPIVLPVSTVVFIIRCLDTKKNKGISI
jgi:hypothetical protein